MDKTSLNVDGMSLNIEQVGEELRVELFKPDQEKPMVFFVGPGKAYYDAMLSLVREMYDLDSRDKAVKEIIQKFRSELYGF